MIKTSILCYLHFVFTHTCELILEFKLHISNVLYLVKFMHKNSIRAKYIEYGLIRLPGSCGFRWYEVYEYYPNLLVGGTGANWDTELGQASSRKFHNMRISVASFSRKEGYSPSTWTTIPVELADLCKQVRLNVFLCLQSNFSRLKSYKTYTTIVVLCWNISLKDSYLLH